MPARVENSRWVAVVVAVGVILGTEAHLVLAARERAARAGTVLAAKESELDSLRHHSPALTDENIQAANRNLARAREVRAAYDVALRGAEPERWEATVPPRSLDARFELDSFVDRERRRARQVGVHLKADERFGFASYVHDGPEPDLIPAVHRQRVVVEYLLEVLGTAKPVELMSAKRSQPAAEPVRRPRGAGAPEAGERATARTGSAWEAPEDFFVPDKMTLLRPDRAAGDDVFRLEFTGDTSTLREFLEGLAAFQLPLFVRTVEAFPSGVAARGASHFVVVIELVGLPAGAGGRES